MDDELKEDKGKRMVEGIKKTPPRNARPFVEPFICATEILPDDALEALKLLEKDVEFEIIEILSFERTNLSRREIKICQDWCHLCFIAKPKNADVSPKHYLAEYLIDNACWLPKHCSTFEPSGDPAFEHGCNICPADQKIHPSVEGYIVGSEPYYELITIWA